MQLAEQQAAFEALGIGVAAMTYDDREILATFRTERALGYPLLQDVDARHVEAWGVRNPDYGPGSSNYGVALPGMAWIGPDGRILGKWAVPDYRERPPFDDVIEEIGALLVEMR